MNNETSQQREEEYTALSEALMCSKPDCIAKVKEIAGKDGVGLREARRRLIVKALRASLTIDMSELAAAQRPIGD